MFFLCECGKHHAYEHLVLWDEVLENGMWISLFRAPCGALIPFFNIPQPGDVEEDED